jgi:hypothetical protein
MTDEEAAGFKGPSFGYCEHVYEFGTATAHSK